MDSLQLRTAWLVSLAMCCLMPGALHAEGQTDTNRQQFINSSTNGLGAWIWAAEVHDRQTCLMWKSFEIPSSNAVVKAHLRMTADNEFTLYLDGRELGRGAEWRNLHEFNLTRLMSPGRHILAVNGFNSASYAGMILGFCIELADGSVIEIRSDESWRIVPDGVRGWERKAEAPPTWPSATIVGWLGKDPWWTTPQQVDVIPPLEPVKTYFWQTGWFQISLATICGLAVVICFRLVAQITLHQKERWLLQRERARIAKDIHDDIGSRMTQLVLHGEVAQSELPEDSEMRAHLARICEDARQVLNSMDEILWAVNPKRDTLRDFVAYVCDYAQEFLKATSINCLLQVELDMSSEGLELAFRRSLLMVIKEALNNAVKHSGATELQLRIERQGQNLIVIVQDNGKGFDQAIAKPERNGMANMADRLSELGGSLQIISRQGRGCRIELNVPLAHSRKSSILWRRISNRKSKNQKNSQQAPALTSI